MEEIPGLIARELKVKPQQVTATINLLDGGNTVPFIARYRKEATGELDEELLRVIMERLTYLRNLLSRQQEVRRIARRFRRIHDAGQAVWFI